MTKKRLGRGLEIGWQEVGKDAKREPRKEVRRKAGKQLGSS